MTHAEFEQLAAEYFDDVLDPAIKAEAEDHLKNCPACLEMAADIHDAMNLCRSAEKQELPPALIPSIIRATSGWKPAAESVGPYAASNLRQRLAYGFAMAVFSLALIANASGVKLRHVDLNEFNPLGWAQQASQSGRLFASRAGQFYVPIVDEITATFKDAFPAKSRPAHPMESPGAPSGTILLPAGAFLTSAPLGRFPYLRGV